MLREVRQFRDQIVDQLPKFDIARFDKLEEYAKALAQAQANYAISSEPEDDLRALYEEAFELREVLFTDITALVRRGLLKVGALKAYTGTVGFKIVAAELITMARLLDEAYLTIQGKCATSKDEIQRATRIGTHILRVVGEREQGPVEIDKAIDTRLRAFTLFILAYNDARRAVAFIRSDEGDVDSIIPSLYAGRGGSKKQEKVEATTDAPAATAAAMTPAAPAVTTTTPPPVAPTNGAAPTAGGQPTPGPNPLQPFVS